MVHILAALLPRCAHRNFQKCLNMLSGQLLGGRKSIISPHPQSAASLTHTSLCGFTQSGWTPPPGVDKYFPALLVAVADYLSPSSIEAPSGPSQSTEKGPLQHWVNLPIASVMWAVEQGGLSMDPSLQGRELEKTFPQGHRPQGHGFFKRHLRCCICFLMRSIRPGD